MKYIILAAIFSFVTQAQAIQIECKSPATVYINLDRGSAITENKVYRQGDCETRKLLPTGTGAEILCKRGDSSEVLTVDYDPASIKVDDKVYSDCENF